MLAQCRRTITAQDVRIAELEQDLRYMSSDHRLRDYAELEDTITAQAAQLEQAQQAAIHLVGKIRKIHESDEYRAVWECAQTHRGPYRGESYEDELNALANWLAANAHAPQEERTE